MILKWLQKNKFVFLIFICIVGILLLQRIENVDNVKTEIETEDDKFLLDLINYITSDMSYKDYIDWLNLRQNTHVGLVKRDLFYELRVLKKRNELDLSSLKKAIES